MHTCPVTLSYHAASKLLAARRQQTTRTQISPDLNRTLTDVELSEEGVCFAEGLLLSWAEVGNIAEDDAGCYACTTEGIYKIQTFSEELQRVYTLYPTAAAPTMLISGIPMHRIKHTDPHQGTLSKLRALGRISGRVLDTCTGLGYTALAAAAHADHVTTVELDPAVHAIIQQNPWSCMLFDAPNITTSIGDVAEEIETYPDQAFDAVLHDPPMFSLAGDLFSLAFYHQLYRVLRKGGRLFHYIGNPQTRSGATVTRGVLKRLGEAGFQRLQERPQAFGVTAVK
mgnify:CR=1 FL=1